MKRRLLFVMNNLGCGGAEKSLITLFNCIDYSRYDVSLFLFEHTGAFVNMIPENINLCLQPQYWSVLNTSFLESFRTLAKNKRYDIAFARIAQAILCKKYKNHALVEQKLWKYIKCAFDRLEGKYDAVIGYLEKKPIYFSIDKVEAKKRIGWIHTSYINLKINPKTEEQYFKKLNYIVTVSNQSANELKCMFPGNSDKVRVIKNIIAPDEIINLSKEKVNFHSNMKYKIVTVARLDYLKGIDIAIEACYKLLEEGYDFSWHVLGEGQQRKEIEEKIKSYRLDKNFILEGIKANPYPYIRHADIYVQPSRSEAYGIAIAEARVLCRPMVTTNFPAAVEQVSNGIDGLVVDICAEAVYKGVKNLLDSQYLRDKFSSNLESIDFNNISEIQKLYELIEQ